MTPRCEPRRLDDSSPLRDLQPADRPQVDTGTAPAPRRTVLAALLVPMAFVVLWSSGFVGAELGTRVTSADTLLMWRFISAGAILLMVCAATRRRIGLDALRRHVPLGLLMQFLYLFGVFHGVQYGVSGSTAALIAALQPVLVAVAATVALREPLSWRSTVGLVLGFTGVAIVVADGLGAGSAPGWAYLLPVGAMLALAAGTVAQQRSADRTDLLTGLTVQTLTAAVAFTGWALFTGQAAPVASWSFGASVTWLVVLAGFGGYGTYQVVLRRHGAALVSALLYLTPPTTAVWTALMFGDPLRLTAAAGMVVSIVGVLLFLRSRRPTGGAQPRTPRSAGAAAD